MWHVIVILMVEGIFYNIQEGIWHCWWEKAEHETKLLLDAACIADVLERKEIRKKKLVYMPWQLCGWHKF